MTFEKECDLFFNVKSCLVTDYLWIVPTLDVCVPPCVKQYRRETKLIYTI